MLFFVDNNGKTALFIICGNAVAVIFVRAPRRACLPAENEEMSAKNGGAISAKSHRKHVLYLCNGGTTPLQPVL
jgi:hypothetical protein